MGNAASTESPVPAPPTLDPDQEVLMYEAMIEQGKSMAALYICDRLKRSDVYQPRFGMRRMRSLKLLQEDKVVDNVYPTLAYIGTELETMHPRPHTNVARQMGVGSFKSEQHLAECITLWAKFKYSEGRCNWADVVSLFAVAGGTAVDCVRQGNPEFIPGAVKGVTQVLEEIIGIWIHHNGGWIALDAHYRVKPTQSEWTICELTVVITAFTIILIVILGLVTQFILNHEDML